MVQAVIFDCFGVLATDIWLAFCDQLPPGADIAEASALNKAFDKGLIEEDDFMEGVKAATGQYPPLLEDMKGSQIAKNTALLDFIRTLKPKYKIGLLSNISSSWITDELLTLDEQLLFDSIVLSHEVGMIKPDPRIYMLTCERLRVAPHEALMIDDRMMYVDGAQAQGLQGIVYDDFRSFKQQFNELLGTDY